MDEKWSITPAIYEDVFWPYVSSGKAEIQRVDAKMQKIESNGLFHPNAKSPISIMI